MQVYGKGKISRFELFELARLTREAFWTGIEFLKKGKKLDMVTTDDLEQVEIPGKGLQFKLRSNYLERRKQRKALAKKKRGDSFR